VIILNVSKHLNLKASSLKPFYIFYILKSI